MVGTEELETKQSPKRSFWSKIREFASSRERNGGQPNPKWSHYGLTALTPQILILQNRQAQQLYEIVKKEDEAGASPSASQINRFQSSLKRVAQGLARSKRSFAIFSFGMTSDQCGLETVFPNDALHITSSGDPGRTGIVAPCFCMDDARKVIFWTREAPGRVAVVLASSEAHLAFLAIACVLYSSSSQGRSADICSALSMFGQARARGVNSLQLTSTSAHATETTTSSPSNDNNPLSRCNKNTRIKVRTKGNSAVRRWSRGSNNSSKGSTNDEHDVSASALRVVGTMGYLRPAVPFDAETTRWRRMILRKVILSHAPRVLSEHLGAQRGCRPYIMVMNGDQSDFLHSTMVQGIRPALYSMTADVAFDINRRVDRDVVLKVYHLEPGQPGRVLFQVHVNVASAEPVEDAAIYDQYPEGEQLVLVNVPKNSIDVLSLANTLDDNFQISCVFGMQATDRAVELEGPRGFRTEENLSGYGGADGSASVPPLDMQQPLPPMQFKCSNDSCGHLQYIQQGDVNSTLGSGLGRGGINRISSRHVSSKTLTCALCSLQARASPSVNTMVQEIAESSSSGDRAAGCGFVDSTSTTEAEDDDDARNNNEGHTSDEEKSNFHDDFDHSSVRSGSPISIPAPAPGPAAGTTHGTASAEAPANDDLAIQGENSEDTELEPAGDRATLTEGEQLSPTSGALSTVFNEGPAFEARVQSVCEVLGALRITERRDIERRLGMSLAGCSSEAEADQAVQNFVIQSLEGFDDRSPSRRVSRRNVRFTLGARGDDDAQVRFNLPSGGSVDESGDAITDNAPRVSMLRGGSGREESLMEQLFASMLTVQFADNSGLRRRRSMGMSEREILRLPEHEYRLGNYQGDQMNCLICLGDYCDGDCLRTLPCFHRFHSDCIVRWLLDNAKCPICQRDAHDYSHE